MSKIKLVSLPDDILRQLSGNLSFKDKASLARSAKGLKRVVDPELKAESKTRLLEENQSIHATPEQLKQLADRRVSTPRQAARMMALFPGLAPVKLASALRIPGAKFVKNAIEPVLSDLERVKRPLNAKQHGPTPFLDSHDKVRTVQKTLDTSLHRAFKRHDREGVMQAVKMGASMRSVVNGKTIEERSFDMGPTADRGGLDVYADATSPEYPAERVMRERAARLNGKG